MRRGDCSYQQVMDTTDMTATLNQPAPGSGKP